MIRVSFDPNAPPVVGHLPDYWDQRRERQGKPDASTCAADLREALEFTARQLRRQAHALQHNNAGDWYKLGQAKGLLDAADLLAGNVELVDVGLPREGT